MPKNQLFINGNDAYVRYGISMDDTALSTLMGGLQRKEWIKNELRSEHGTRYVTSAPPKVQQREVSLGFHMYADNEQQFMARFRTFEGFLRDSGVITLHTSFEPTVRYRLLFSAIAQFTQYRREYARISVRFIEPNPTDRSL